MLFGMPTLIGKKSIEECAVLCRELGLDFIEINMCVPEYQADRLDIEQLSGISERYGIFYTIHLDDTNTPCDFNDKIAEAYTGAVLQTIETAKQLSVPILNMHLSEGTYFTLPEKKVFLFEEYREEYMKKLTAFRDACEAAIDSSNIKLCVENTRVFTHAFGAESLSVLLQSQVFGVTFDIGHDAGNNFKQRPLIDKNISRLCHMHLHDAKPGEGRNHMTLGAGELELSKYLDLAKAHNCRIVLEIKTVDGLRRSVEWLKERGIF